MKILFSKETMLEAISIAQSIISMKAVDSIYSGVLMDSEENEIFIRATDAKIDYEAQIPAQILESGKMVVYCDKFAGILNSLPSGEIEVFHQENEDNQLIDAIIKPVDKKIKFQMKSMVCSNFPELCFDEDIPYFEISLRDFKEMIVQTLFAVSIEESRHFLNGVFFEKQENNLNLVATDGRRLSFISKPILEGIEDFSPVIVHPKILNIILKYAPNDGNILIAFSGKKIFFKFANYKFSATLLEGQFPNYVRVIPKKQSFVFYVKKIDLDNAMNKHISLMLDKKINRIYFDISHDVLKITSLNPEIGSVDEEIPCDFSDEPHTIAFNFSYIEEPLREIKTERIAFEFTEEMKAVTMRPEPEQDYFHIIMPMQKE